MTPSSFIGRLTAHALWGKKMKMTLVMFGFALLGLLVYAQHEHHQQPADPPAAQGDLADTTRAMGHHHEDHEHMGAHSDPQPGDAEKAQKVVDQAREALKRYRDSNSALADGFKIFLPNVPQKMYHFTSWPYAVGEAFRFDPSKPTSLLYEKKGN